MASRSTLQGIGVALVVLGVGFGLWGYQESQALGNELVSTIVGEPSDQVMTLYIGGAVSLAVGLFLLFRR